MRGQVDNIDWAFAAQKEKEFRHDVMGHIHAFGHVCPKVGNWYWLIWISPARTAAAAATAAAVIPAAFTTAAAAAASTCCSCLLL